jgi:type IV pilus secretin PilQ/predicted competence protein
MKRTLLYMTFCLAIFVIAQVFSMPAGAEPGDDDTNAEAASVPKRLITLQFPETPLNTVLDVLSIKTGKKFITDIELAKKKVLLNLRDVTAEEALNALLDTNNLYYIRQSETSNIYVIKSKPDQGQPLFSQQIFFLSFSGAKELEPTIKQKLSKNGQVSVDERTNSLVVSDTGDNLDKISAILKALDIPTLQVQLEAKIVEVKLDSDLQMGVNITSLGHNDKYYTDPLSLYYKNTYGTADSVIPVTAVSHEYNYSQTFAPGLSSGSGVFSFGISNDSFNMSGSIEASKTDTNTQLLTNPRLLVMNNNEATIDIVDQIPYQQATVANGATTESTMFKDVGIKLKVKPQINRDGTIILTVVPENSFVNGYTSDNIPIINMTKASTVFIMRDGETAVIGGLISESKSDTETKVPLLGDIPIIGYLFKKKSTGKQRAELTIFIRAKIIQQ